MYTVAAISIVLISFGLPEAWMALVVFVVGMLALGMGNGAVFQLVPQRFQREIGVMTWVVGMCGGLGGFYLASSLGYSKQYTGSYGAGFLVFAVLAERHDGAANADHDQEARVTLDRNAPSSLRSDAPSHEFVRAVFDRYDSVRDTHTPDA